MPGINIIADFTESVNHYQSSIKAAQSSLIYNDKITYSTLLHDNVYFAGYSKYESYPVELLENDQFFVCLEGKIFKRAGPDLQDQIFSLAKYVFSAENSSKNDIIEWLRTTDGEFVILFYNKLTREIVILNDILGRLPLYFHHDRRTLIVTREIKFIIPFLDTIAFDRTGIAEYLLFRYALGTRTLLKDVSRVQPATLIRINPSKGDVEVHRLFEFNYEIKSNAHKDVTENAEKLVELFVESCKSRSCSFNPPVNVVSLSGGLDSRAVGAGLHRAGVPFSCATYLDYEGRSREDIRIAEIVAQKLGCEWIRVPLGPLKRRQLLNLLQLKDGQNYLAMGFILEFFEHLRTFYGPDLTYYTGDGGDKVLLNLKPGKNVGTRDELVDYILKNNGIVPLDDIEKMTGVRKEEIIDDITRLLEGYPESDFNQKYVHFLFSERAFKWLFEGEDRNRFYFWTASPFYSIRFFDYAMNCPDEQKKWHSLYRQFMHRLSPSLCAIDNSNWGFPMQSKKLFFFYFLMEIYERIPSQKKVWLKTHVLGLKAHDNPDSPVVRSIRRCIGNQIENCPPITSYLSPRFINKTSISEFSLQQLYPLLTVVSYIELLKCQSSSLTRFDEPEIKPEV